MTGTIVSRCWYSWEVVSVCDRYGPYLTVEEAAQLLICHQKTCSLPQPGADAALRLIGEKLSAKRTA